MAFVVNALIAKRHPAEGSRRVAVGMAIADHPPHRSVRALLTHTALTLDEERQSER
jgi:hypothetical protein